MSAKPLRAVEGSQDSIHVPFIVASLLFGVLGGFSLAFSLPVEALAGSFDVSWVAHAQVHGHLQVVGFAGLFVVGMAFKLAPRFGGQRLMSVPGGERWVLWLLVAGLLGRTVGQPLAETPAFGALTVAGSVAEAGGATLFLVMMWLTLATAVRKRQPSALPLVGGAVGFLAQAVLGVWWLSELAMERREILGGRENAVLLHLQFFGVLLPAILGVGMRSFPTFFGRQPPGPRAGNLVALAALGGITIWTAGGILGIVRGGDWWVWTVLGQALSGAAILAAILSFGPWRTPSRLAAASKGLAWSLHPAVLWLAMTGILLLATALQSAAAREATVISAAYLGREAGMAAKLPQPLLMNVITRLAPKVMPFPLEIYLQYHFSKVGVQTRMMLDHWIEEGHRRGLPTGSLQELRSGL